MSVIRRGMTDKELVVQQGIVHFKFFEHCESPTMLKEVGGGFRQENRLYERIRFVFLETNKGAIHT